MKIKRILGIAFSVMLGMSVLGACSEDNSNGSSGSAETSASSNSENLTVVSTTGYLTDAINNVAPDVEVRTLVAPGGDPHTQELTTADIEAVNEADLVVWTSHDMEHRMRDHFDKLGERSHPAAEVIDESKLLPWEDEVDGHDPHVWNSPELWQEVVTGIGEKFAEIDPDNAQTYRDNAAAYNEKIQAAHEKASEQLSKIPEENRYLITGHDAFNYLGDTYNMTVLATDLVTSEAEISAAELDELAQTIADHNVPVIFQDNLKNPEAIKHLQDSVVAKGGKVEVSDKVLYADTLGDSAPTDTYLGAFEHNVQAIVEALS